MIFSHKAEYLSMDISLSGWISQFPTILRKRFNLLSPACGHSTNHTPAGLSATLP